MKPLISVILPVHNGERYLEESIESILHQTFQNFEIIAIDDGSQDGSVSLLKSFRDKRLRIFIQENQGLASTLNRAIHLAKGEFLARHDQDDIALPARFERQLEFMKQNSKVMLVGTWAQIWKENKKTDSVHRHSPDSPSLKFELLFDNPFVHSSVMIRKLITEKTGLYSVDPKRQPPEDYEYWSRIARKYEIGNIPQILQIYRETSGSMSRSGINIFRDKVIKISIENISFLLRNSLPRGLINDCVYLYHDAYSRISPDTSFKDISNLVTCAYLLIKKDQRANNNYLDKRFKSVLSNLKKKFIYYKHGKAAGVILTWFS